MKALTTVRHKLFCDSSRSLTAPEPYCHPVHLGLVTRGSFECLSVDISLPLKYRLPIRVGRCCHQPSTANLLSSLKVSREQTLAHGCCRLLDDSSQAHIFSCSVSQRYWTRLFPGVSIPLALAVALSYLTSFLRSSAFQHLHVICSSVSPWIAARTPGKIRMIWVAKSVWTPAELESELGPVPDPLRGVVYS
jgi:hypothetical protein